MKYTVKFNVKNDEKLIKDVMKLDSLCYSQDMQGTFDTIYARYSKNKDSFVLIYDKDYLIGYICFFPISNRLMESIYKYNNFHDTDIQPEDIVEYGKSDKYNIFIISVVIHPTYQGSEVIKYLSDSFVDRIKYINQNNKTNKIIGISVSNKGSKFMEKLNLSKIKELKNGHMLYDCDYARIRR